MDKIDRLAMKAKSLTDPPLKPWERAMMANQYIGRDQDELVELLTMPQEDWRLIVQAMAWNGGGLHGTNSA